MSTGRLGVENVARTVEEWAALLAKTGWHALDWAGVRLSSDTALGDLSPEEFDALLNLERDAGSRESFRRVARLIHLLARTAS
ncbi:MAG: hypothetical protein ACRD1T_27815 [Acidimicrobiia bacterium]